MAYTVFDDALGFVDLYLADTAGPGPEAFAGSAAGTYGRFNHPGIELRGRDFNLGGATFVFAKAAAAVTATQVCELTQAVTSGRYDVSAQPWAGAANTGKPICVAMATLAVGQWGWFQVQGLAIATCSGAPVAGNVAYWQAAGAVSPTAVAGKSVWNAQFASAPGVTIGSGASAVALSATQALLLLNRPSSEGVVT
jgi:hypothetical protein